MVADFLANAGEQPAIEEVDMLGVADHLPISDFTGLSQPYSQIGGQRARSHAPFLPTPTKQARQPDPGLPPHIESPHSLRPINFMPTNTHQVDIHLVDV